MNRVWRAAESFEPRGIPLALVRSILAFAQLTTILLSPDRLLFANPLGTTPETRCAGLNGVSLWCVTGGDAQADTLGRVLAIAALLVVVVGYRPRWSCIAHWYIAFSIAVDGTATNGGDRVAEILTMLLIPICLDDRRSWSWRMPTRPLRPAWRGSAFAAHAMLRCQIAIIYLNAVISKLTFPAWHQGTALGILAHDPEYGVPSVLRPFAQQLLSHAWATDLLTWSVLAVETLIALSMAFRRRTRSYGLLLAILLHGAIILLMGLFSFGLIMITLVLAACADMPDVGSTCDHNRQEALPSRSRTRIGTSP
ncbi:antimicrobial peptide system SdpB family protein [Streptacidiphilus sp. MAP12-16]|uniref:sporulation-delaying protein SdpB family protein n=1 Tax=Streptacidiphilus sp. MAP12-16 TaxID=3156300 RepID=UPI003514C558